MSNGLAGLWESIRGKADDPSLGYIGASMLPGVGEATDVVEIGAGLQDRDPGRIALGITALALPFVGAAGLKKLFKGKKKLPKEKLPMDRGSRSSRAYHEGYDLELYHGTKKDIHPSQNLTYPKGSAGQVTLAQGRGIMRKGGDWTTLEPQIGDLGKGIYLSGSKGAEPYALGGKGAWGRKGSQARFYPVKVRSGKLLKAEYVDEYGEIRWEGEDDYYSVLEKAKERLAERADLDPELADALRYGYEDRWSGSGPLGVRNLELDEEIQNVAKESGYEGLWIGKGETPDPQSIPNPNVMIFESKNIRSPSAAFDPKKRHVADLMAGIAGLSGARYMMHGDFEDSIQDEVQ